MKKYDAAVSETKPELPKEKQTVLGLYVTAKEAYEKWQADPEKVKILDVRTPEEYIFVGHKGKRMKNGWINSGVPWTYEVNPEKMRLPMSK
jgi:3-mercaptopyruvate sulfurtransferase SseA